MWILRASASLRAFVRKKGVHGMHLEQSLSCSKCSINVVRLIHFHIATTGTEKVLRSCMVGGQLEHAG